MTTYYVDGAVGNDANAGTSEGAGNAWATIDKAMNTVVAGDLVYVKASATYDENANIDTAGTINSWVVFEGYSTTPGDNGKPTWKNTSGIALTDTPATNFYLFKNFSFDGSSSIGADISALYTAFFNCDFINNGSIGLRLLTATGAVVINCTFTGNSGAGLYSTGQYTRVIGCISGANGAQGIYIGNSFGVAIGNVVYGNNSGVDALYIASDASTVYGNTIDGDGTTGACMNFNDKAPLLAVNNVLHDAAHGIFCSDTADARAASAPFMYNLLNSLTNKYYTGSVEWSTLAPLKNLQDVESAPAFTNEAGDDYTLGATSPAIDAGLQPGGIT